MATKTTAEIDAQQQAKLREKDFGMICWLSRWKVDSLACADDTAAVRRAVEALGAAAAPAPPHAAGGAFSR